LIAHSLISPKSIGTISGQRTSSVKTCEKAAEEENQSPENHSPEEAQEKVGQTIHIKFDEGP